jgi:hypothetical protein
VKLITLIEKKKDIIIQPLNRRSNKYNEKSDAELCRKVCKTHQKGTLHKMKWERNDQRVKIFKSLSTFFWCSQHAIECSIPAPLHIYLTCIMLQYKGFNFLNHKCICSHIFWLANEEIKTFTDTKMITLAEISLLDQDSCMPSDNRTHDHTVCSTHLQLYCKPSGFCTVYSWNIYLLPLIMRLVEQLQKCTLYFLLYNLCCSSSLKTPVNSKS